MSVDRNKFIKDKILEELREDSKEQHALNRIIKSHNIDDKKLNGDEFWLIQNMIDDYLWLKRNAN